jgi:hypothetical protein
MLINFNSSGFLVQTKSVGYKGFYGLLEDDIWPLDLTNEKNQELKKYFYDFIHLAWKDDNRVDLCENHDFVKKYYKACNDEEFNTDIKFCMASKNQPNINPSQIKKIIQNAEFVGYDYAWSGGDFYSAVFSDVFTKRITGLMDLNLNQYGLFDTEESIVEFVKRRNKLIEVSSDPIAEFEGGDFCYYKIWVMQSNYFDA